MDRLRTSFGVTPRRHPRGIDAQTLGVSREKHHRYLINDPSTEGVLLYQGDDCVGYAYIAEGHIGPMAVKHSDHMATAFRTALAIAADRSTPQVTAFVSGPCEAALKAAIGGIADIGCDWDWMPR